MSKIIPLNCGEFQKFRAEFLRVSCDFYRGICQKCITKLAENPSQKSIMPDYIIYFVSENFTWPKLWLPFNSFMLKCPDLHGLQRFIYSPYIYEWLQYDPSLQNIVHKTLLYCYLLVLNCV